MRSKEQTGPVSNVTENWYKGTKEGTPAYFFGLTPTIPVLGTYFQDKGKNKDMSSSTQACPHFIWPLVLLITPWILLLTHILL